MIGPSAPPVPLRADEFTMLSAFLDHYRAALLDRAHDLTEGQLNMSLAPSSLTLSRLIGHMAFVEQVWYRERFSGDGFKEPFASLDFDRDPDAEMTLAQTWSTDKLHRVFEDAVLESRLTVQRATSLDELSRADRDGERWSLRWIMVHMIEEYARHCGHADLIRESIDGDVLSRPNKPAVSSGD